MTNSHVYSALKKDKQCNLNSNLKTRLVTTNKKLNAQVQYILYGRKHVVFEQHKNSNNTITVLKSISISFITNGDSQIIDNFIANDSSKIVPATCSFFIYINDLTVGLSSGSKLLQH